MSLSRNLLHRTKQCHTLQYDEGGHCTLGEADAVTLMTAAASDSGLKKYFLSFFLIFFYMSKNELVD